MAQIDLLQLPDQPVVETTMETTITQPAEKAGILTQLPDRTIATPAPVTEQPDKKQEEQTFLNSKAEMLGLEPTELRTGTLEFKEALRREDKKIERPTFLGSLGEGLKLGSAGEIIGEGVATGLISDFVVPGLIRDKEDLAIKLITKNPDKEQAIRAELSKDAIDLTSPDVWELVGDSAEAALDLVFLGRGKVMANNVKTVLKQVAKQLEKESTKTGGKEAIKKFIQLLRVNLFESGKQLTRFKSVVGQPAIVGTQAAGASLARGETGGDATLDGIKAALFTAGLQLVLGPVARIVGKKATGTKLEKFLSPKLTPKLARAEAKEGLLVTTKDKQPKIKLRLPSNQVKEVAPVVRKRLPGIENQDVATAISDIDSEITRSSKVMSPKLQKVRTPIQTKQRTIKALNDAEDELINSADFPDEQIPFIKKQFNFARKQIRDESIKNVDEFQNLRKKIDNSTADSVKDYNPLTGNNPTTELKQIIWKKKRDIFNDESMRIADKLEDTGLGIELKELTQLFRASDNLQTHITQLEVLTLGEKLKNIPTLFVGGIAGSAGAKVTR